MLTRHAAETRAPRGEKKKRTSGEEIKKIIKKIKGNEIKSGYGNVRERRFTLRLKRRVEIFPVPVSLVWPFGEMLHVPQPARSSSVLMV